MGNAYADMTKFLRKSAPEKKKLRETAEENNPELANALEELYGMAMDMYDAADPILVEMYKKAERAGQHGPTTIQGHKKMIEDLRGHLVRFARTFDDTRLPEDSDTY